MFGDKLDLDLDNMIFDIANSIVLNAQQNSDFEDFKYQVISNFGIETPFSEKEILEKDISSLAENLYNTAKEKYQRKVDNIKTQAFPVIKSIYENKSDNIENIK